MITFRIEAYRLKTKIATMEIQIAEGETKICYLHKVQLLTLCKIELRKFGEWDWDKAQRFRN